MYNAGNLFLGLCLHPGLQRNLGVGHYLHLFVPLFLEPQAVFSQPLRVLWGNSLQPLPGINKSPTSIGGPKLPARVLEKEKMNEQANLTTYQLTVDRTASMSIPISSMWFLAALSS